MTEAVRTKRSPAPPVVLEPPPYPRAALVVLGTFLLYLATLAPTTQFWDTSEYIAAAKVLGIPHPPGNPLFTLIAHVWGDLLFFVEHYAKRINLFAASTSAVAAGCWFLIGERWMRAIVPAVWPRRLAALGGALVAATAFTVWNQSVVNEKVYTLSLLSIALVLWLIVRWDDQPLGEAHDHYLLLIIYLLALTSTNHMMGVLVGPVVVILLFPLFKKEASRPPEGQRGGEWAQWAVFTSVLALLVAVGLEDMAPVIGAGALFLAALVLAYLTGNTRFALASLAVAAVGLSVYLFLPIRAAHFPPINEGEPTNWNALWSVLTREQYGKGPVTARQATLVAQVQMWWQYFTWQFGRDWPGAIQRGLAVLFFTTGILGAWRHWKADRRTALAMTTLVATLTLLLIFYLNFKYGFSQYENRPQLGREVRERDYFYIASFALWGVWVGLGLATLMEWVQEWFAARVPEPERRWTLATPVLALALIPLVGNHLTAPRHGETIARDFAVALLQSVEPYGILVTAGDNDTFPLWYAQEVEGVRRDVSVVNLSLANTDWYLRQMQRRPVEPFDSTTAPAIYRGRAWPMPTGKLMTLDPDGIQLYYIIEARQQVQLGPITATIDPQWLGKQYVERADVAVLQIIKDQMGKRPIYFSRTVGLYADQFGLTGNLEGHGFARKLLPQTITPSDSVQAVGSLGFVNIARTQTLVFDIYHGSTAARARPRGWVDQPSEGIISLYGLTYQSMAEALRTRNPEAASRALVMADSVFKNTSIRFSPPAESGN